MRTLAITENVTVDGSIEMLKDWFDPKRQGDTDKSDLLEEEQRQGREADALLVGRRTFEAFREYWPKQTDDTTGITDYLNRVGSSSIQRSKAEAGGSSPTATSSYTCGCWTRSPSGAGSRCSDTRRTNEAVERARAREADVVPTVRLCRLPLHQRDAASIAVEPR